VADGPGYPRSDGLRPGGLHNLTIQAGCLATRLHVRHGRCTGVSYLCDGTYAEAHTSGEVIVCAGAVGSPHLLMLSGIGPGARLRTVGIDPVADIPGVEENLQDHPVVMACHAAPAPLPRSRHNHGEVYAVLRSPLARLYPDRHRYCAATSRTATSTTSRPPRGTGSPGTSSCSGSAAT
jgi:choline dehydrogenase